MRVDRPQLWRPSAASCAAILWRDGKPAGGCWREPTHVGWIVYEHPKPRHETPAFLCPEHAELVEKRRPLNDADRAELARRRTEAAHWDTVRQENRRNAGWTG